MHEMHLVSNLFNDLLRRGKELGARKITKVYLRMGTFNEINIETLEHFFRENGKETILEEAKLKIESSPTREFRLLSFDYK
jgi:Zn finger protein HypA/HybF involved in hydrogenase expression